MIIERMGVAEVAPVPSSDKLMLADTVIPVLRDLLDCFRGVEGRTHAEFSGRNPYGVPEFKAAQDLLIVLREMIQSYRPIRTIGASDLQHRAEEQGKMLWLVTVTEEDKLKD